MDPIEVREYGEQGPQVVVLHGGPGAPGSVTAVAEMLGDEFRILEPLQRRSGAVPLSVQRHVEDLAAVMTEPATLVGWSWGAMLSLCFAVVYPQLVRSIVLIGCGTYDEPSRTLYHNAMASQADPRQPERPDDFDAAGGAETWADVLRRQAEGVEPQAFVAIKVPVLMLHGDQDPHPGPNTRDLLRRYIPQLEYRELHGCGHTPWTEPNAHADFLDELRSWLVTHG